jgi:hypothetical protein
MSDIEKLLKDMYAETSSSEDDVSAGLSQNFSVKELAKFSSLLTLYTPLLEKSERIYSILLELDVERSMLNDHERNVLVSWLNEYKTLNMSMESFLSKNTIH